MTLVVWNQNVVKEFRMFRYGHLGFHHGPGVFGWLFLVVIAALFVVAVVLLILTMVRLRRHPRGQFRSILMGTPGPGVDPAIAELRLRYARGEITWEEHMQRSHNLGYPPPPEPGPPPGAPTPPAA